MRPNDPIMAMHENGEGDGGQGKPPGGSGAAPPEGEKNSTGQEREEPGMAEKAVAARQCARRGLPAGQACTVLVTGGRGHAPFCLVPPWAIAPAEGSVVYVIVQR